MGDVRHHHDRHCRGGAQLAHLRWQGDNAERGLGNCRRLVSITLSCSSVNVLGALVVGVVCGTKFWLGFDDSLDVVRVHVVGGLVGTLLAGPGELSN